MQSQDNTGQISAAHQQYLADHAIAPELAQAVGVYSQPDGALIVPWRSLSNGSVDQIVRPDLPKDQRYRFGAGAKTEFNALRTDGQVALLVEGTKQSLAAATWVPLGVAVYGMIGIWGWMRDGEPIPDVAALAKRHTDIVVVPDADAAQNQNVYSACTKLKPALIEHGATSVRFARLVGASGSDGLDDVLARLPATSRTAYLQQLIERAADKPADAPPNLMPPPGVPLEVARKLAREHAREGVPTLRRWRGDWYWWMGDRWILAEELGLRSWLYDRLGKAVYQSKDEIKPWNPNAARIGQVYHALEAVQWLIQDTDAPCWFGDDAPDPLPIAAANGLLQMADRELGPHDPRFFNLVSVPFDYDPAAPKPARWLSFLHEDLWPNEEDHVRTLQEWFGYVLSGATNLQKILALIGPIRGGKGTIARVLEQLVGKGNHVGLILSSFGNNFGLQPLIGKPLAVITDARLSKRTDPAVVVERLLSISGEDTLTIDRKYQAAWTGKLPTRLMFTTNEPPAFQDSSGAIASRFIVLRLTQSYYGREDPELEAALAAELPGIFNWALDGLDRLHAQQRLSEPGRSSEMVMVMRDAASPVGAFVRQMCVVGEEYGVPVPELFQAWTTWCVQNGHVSAGSVQQFGLRLQAVVPELGTGQRQDGNRRWREYRGLRLRVREDDDNDEEAAAWLAATQGDELGQTGTDQDKPGAPEPRRTQSHAGTPIFPAREESEIEKMAAKMGSPRVRLRADNKEDVSRAPARSKVYVPRLAAPSPVGVWEVDRGGTVTPCQDLDEVREWLVAVIKNEGVLTVDVEHTGYQVGHRWHHLKTVQLGGAAMAWVFDVRHINQIPCPCERCGLIRDFLKAAPALSAHSASADLVPLVAAGLCDWDAWDRMYDTVIPAQLADPTVVGADAGGLKDLSRHVLGEQAVAPAADKARAALFKEWKWKTEPKATDPIEKNGWTLVEPSEEAMLIYAASDVLDTALIGQRLPWPDKDLLDRERRVATICARVAKDGLQLFPDHIDEKLREHRAARQEALQHVKQFDIENPASNPQVTKAFTALGVVLPVKPDTGNRSADATVVADIVRQGGPAAELGQWLTTYRKHSHTVTGFLEPWKNLVVYGDGRVRPTVYTLSADSGRMTCVRPNLQGVERQGGTRACIGAEDGMLLIGADLQGIEIRVTAALSQDPALLEVVRAGRDLHKELSLTVFGPNATKEHRYSVKRGVFGWIYGGGLVAIARGMSTPEDAAGRLIQEMNAQFPLLAYWREQNMRDVRAGQTVWTAYTGRPIHLPHRFPHKSSNYKVQGTAREIFVDIILDWGRTRWGDCVLMPVHDELRALVPEDEAEEATATLVELMHRELHGVTILGEADTPARQWSDAS